MECPQCGAPYRPDDRFCIACGAELGREAPASPTSPAACPRCGSEIPAGAVFCPACGAQLTAASFRPQEAPPSPEHGPPSAPGPRPPAVARNLSPPLPQQPKKKSKACCIAIPVAALVLLVACAGVMLMLPHETLRALLGIPESITVNLSDDPPASRAPTARAASSSDGLSTEQQQLVDRLSHPDTFALVIGADEAGRSTRLELWSYHVLGTCFTFEDGAFRGVDEAMEIWEPLDYPALRPEQFRAGMDVEDVNDLVGDIPYVGAEVVAEIAAGTDIYVYNQGLVVAFADGDLVYASTEWALPTDLP